MMLYLTSLKFIHLITGSFYFNQHLLFSPTSQGFGLVVHCFILKQCGWKSRPVGVFWWERAGRDRIWSQKQISIPAELLANCGNLYRHLIPVGLSIPVCKVGLSMTALMGCCEKKVRWYVAAENTWLSDWMGNTHTMLSINPVPEGEDSVFLSVCVRLGMFLFVCL